MKEDGVGGKEECRREGRKNMTRGKKRRWEKKKRKGRRCQVFVVLNFLSDIIYAAGSTLSRDAHRNTPMCTVRFDSEHENTKQTEPQRV